ITPGAQGTVGEGACCVYTSENAYTNSCGTTGMPREGAPDRLGAPTMPIDAQCSHCRKKYRLKDEFAGRSVKGADCQKSFVVPGGARAKSPAAKAPAPAAPRPPAAPKPPARAARNSDDGFEERPRGRRDRDDDRRDRDRRDVYDDPPARSRRRDDEE